MTGSLRDRAVSWFRVSPWGMFVPISKLAGPAFISFISELGLPLSTTFFLGHLGSDVLGASTLASVWCNAFGVAFLIGLAMGLDSLAPHAYGDAASQRLVGLYTQRAIAICTLACIPVAGCWLLCGPALRLIGVPAELAALSQTLVVCRLPALPAIGCFECVRRYLQAQGLTWPSMVTGLTVCALHLLNTWLAVRWFGYRGASYSIVVSEWLLLLLLVAIILVRERFRGRDTPSMRETWPPFVWRDVFNLSGWWQYIRFAAPTMVSLFVEWGGYELFASLVAGMGETTLASVSIMNATTALWYMLPSSITAAAATLVGNSLGGGKTRAAQSAIVMSFIMAMTYGLVNGGLGLVYGRYLAQLFSSDEKVVQLVTSMFPLLWGYLIVDCFKCFGMTMLRGTGRPTITLWGNIGAMLLGYPTAYVMGYNFGWGLAGVWVGIMVAWAFAGLLYGAIVVFTDWDEQVVLTAQELARGHGTAELSSNTDSRALTAFVDDDDSSLATEGSVL